jgi:hypothetical protein
MIFDREAAKKEGYTDAEIDAYLEKNNGQPAPSNDQRSSAATSFFDREAAKQQGYTDEEIDKYLAAPENFNKSVPVPVPYAPGPTGFNWSGAGEALKNSAKGVGPAASQYLKTPAAILDAGLMVAGAPPVGAIAQGRIAAADAAKNAGRALTPNGVLMPALRGASKVLGPAALAMDVYDAAKYAEESRLGQRLSAGQGKLAEKAYRNKNITYGNQSLTPEQLEILKTASPRDRAAFGLK